MCEVCQILAAGVGTVGFLPFMRHQFLKAWYRFTTAIRASSCQPNSGCHSACRPMESLPDSLETCDKGLEKGKTCAPSRLCGFHTSHIKEVPQEEVNPAPSSVSFPRVGGE